MLNIVTFAKAHEGERACYFPWQPSKFPLSTFILKDVTIDCGIEFSLGNDSKSQHSNDRSSFPFFMIEGCPTTRITRLTKAANICYVYMYIL